MSLPRVVVYNEIMGFAESGMSLKISLESIHETEFALWYVVDVGVAILLCAVVTRARPFLSRVFRLYVYDFLILWLKQVGPRNLISEIVPSRLFGKLDCNVTVVIIVIFMSLKSDNQLTNARKLPEVNDRLVSLHNWEIDRKSTRLNSSHITISYAVFCLK